MNKIILSRKGFDNTAGGRPSFIYGDRLISIPIPRVESDIYYRDLHFDEETSLLSVMKDVGIKQFTECHPDPDLLKGLRKERHKHWMPSFGQAGPSETILHEHGVGTGDIFLFYGWFKELIYNNGFQYTRGRNIDKHIIYAYLKVDEVFDVNDPSIEIPEYLHDHPHVIQCEEYSSVRNRIYVGKKGGVFKYHRNLVLTKDGETRSRWELPGFFVGEKFKASVKHQKLKNGNYKFTFKGKNQQELLISSSPEILKWANDIIKVNALQK
jgi:hypothetical protein